MRRIGNIHQIKRKYSIKPNVHKIAFPITRNYYTTDILQRTLKKLNETHTIHYLPSDFYQSPVDFKTYENIKDGYIVVDNLITFRDALVLKNFKFLICDIRIAESRYKYANSLIDYSFDIRNEQNINTEKVFDYLYEFLLNPDVLWECKETPKDFISIFLWRCPRNLNLDSHLI